MSNNVKKEVVSFTPKHMETISTIDNDYVMSKRVDGDSLNSYKKKYLFNQRINEKGDIIGESKFVPIVTRSGRYIEVSLFVTKGHPYYMDQAIKTRPRPVIYLSRMPLDYKPATINDVIEYYTDQVSKTIKANQRAKLNPRIETYSDIDGTYIDSDLFNTRMNEVLEKLVFVSTALK